MYNCYFCIVKDIISHQSSRVFAFFVDFSCQHNFICIRSSKIFWGKFFFFKSSKIGIMISARSITIWTHHIRLLHAIHNHTTHLKNWLKKKKKKCKFFSCTRTNCVTHSCSSSLRPALMQHNCICLPQKCNKTTKLLVSCENWLVSFYSRSVVDNRF